MISIKNTKSERIIIYFNVPADTWQVTLANQLTNNNDNNNQTQSNQRNYNETKPTLSINLNQQAAVHLHELLIISVHNCTEQFR